MAIPKYATPAGAIDGANTLFAVGEAYTPGSLAVFLNGLLTRRLDDDGWTETDPGAGLLTLTTAPRAGDTVNVFYIDTTPPGTEIAVEGLYGVLTAEVDLTAELAPDEELTGVLRQSQQISGTLEPEAELAAQISDGDTITATLHEECT